MKNRYFFYLSTLAVSSACNVTGDTFGSRPNILIAIADDQSFPYAGAYGCNWVETPGFDRVAANGILFNNCYTPNAKSAPSRACVLTGRYSWQLEEAGNHIGFWPEGKYPTFMEALGTKGYRTGFTGKGWAPGNPGMVDGEVRRLTGTPYQSNKLDPPTDKINRTDYYANFRQFLSENDGGEPWIFWYGATEPHRAYEYGSGVAKGGKSLDQIDKVPDYWPDTEAVRNDMLDYAFEIEHFDKHLCAMLDELEKRGELDNTIVIVTADNGMPFPRCKGLGYHDSVHLPLAIMWPAGLKKPGRVCDELVSFVDIAPTVLHLAGVKAEEVGMEPTGKPIDDILEGKAMAGKRPYLLLGQERHDYGRPGNQGYPIRSIIKDGFMYLHNFKPDLWPAGDPVTGYLNCDGSPTKTEILHMRRENADSTLWSMSFGKFPQEQLYNIAADPQCMENLADDPQYAGLKGQLKDILFKDLTGQNDPRVLGQGDVFDGYPFFEPTSFWFYERYVNGEVKEYQTDWVNPDDYETE